MGQRTIAIADKPTLDEVKQLTVTISQKCDQIIAGKGGANLENVEVFIADFSSGEVSASKGVVSTFERKIIPT